MKITKITGTSSYINVHVNDKRIVRIKGEFIVGGFLAYSDTITQWEPPYDNEVIDNKTKELLLLAIVDSSKNSKFKIEFD